jgi:4-amino-4-deoxy-L-arabinose transferase-like glycosyltransferase
VPFFAAPERATRILFWVAALSFIPALFYYYVGEEAITTISTLELWQTGHWTKRELYGLTLPNEPFANWLIVPLAALTGWSHMLVAARLLTIVATLLTAATAGWLAARLTGDRALGWFTALAYITLFDVLFYRGWLAYLDPLFAFFIFGAIAAAWVACERGRAAWFGVAAVALTCAYLTKAITAYVFYGGAVFVFAFNVQRRRVLLSAPSLAWHAFIAAAPIAWLIAVDGNLSRLLGMFAYTASRFEAGQSGTSAARFVTFPFNVALRLLPGLALAAWFAWRSPRLPVPARNIALMALAIAGLGCLPYWASPQSNVRYLLPVFPLFALAFALAIWHAGERARRLSLGVLAVAVALKCVLAAVAFPLYQHQYRGKNYADTARAIAARVGDASLYTINDTAAGLSIAGYLDAARHPLRAVLWPPKDWTDGFVIAEPPDVAEGTLVERYKLGGDEVLLLCRGKACEAATGP